MTAFDYSRSVATANRLIDRFGQTGYIVRRGSATGDEWNPTFAADAEHACRLVETDYTAREIDGTLILASDKKLLVAVSGLTITPAPSDRVKVGGANYEIVSVMPLQPGGTVILYEIQGRA